MNQKEVAAIRKHFKLNAEAVKIADIYNIYIRQDSNEIFHEELRSFPFLEQEHQELFLANFKKVLGGKMDEKLFEVKFQHPEPGQSDHTQTLLYEGLKTDEIEGWASSMQKVALKTVQDATFEKDMVITFIRFKYNKPTRRHSEETEIDMRDEVWTSRFILCSINQTELPKQSLVFDFIEREFKSNIFINPVIKLDAPVGGFMFPSFTDNAADVNHILYAAQKPHQPDYRFIENVLNGTDIVTAVEEKAMFEEVVKTVIGEEVNLATLATVYDEINQIIVAEAEREEEDQTVPVMDARTVEIVLKASGVEDVTTEKVEAAFQQVVDDRQYEMKASSVIPKYTSKSIKINTKVANIAISPQDLKYVKQVNYKGRPCLLIEVEDDTEIEGFKLISEELLD
ncbi:DUF4317 domain-containing protein [Exiguobacterium alkaliphilum]|uniref:DUF4317 domain-containing protein n=1 Tax=Exiguobacterium alkaliphilum TaxID=1428684 RepID=A0ABT2KXJ0_9BACL|nr:DUF4317 domain-containing protein [Exiguobacterium alkaliphilum]MCT4795026.1 DUF4317 domain-containing protein [Exiguobacterium alkaliphilum]